MRASPSVVAGLLLPAILLSGCQGSATGSDPNNPDQVEVLTSWTAGPEGDALDRVTDVFRAGNPGIAVIDASVGGENGDEARESIASRLAADNPPDTFQTVAGAQLGDYVGQGELTDLTGLYERQELAGAFRSSLLELIQVDGKPYGVPSNIHRANVLWASGDALRSAGVDPLRPPADIDAWIENLEALRGKGMAYPLAVGDGSSQAELFESVLIASLGADGYRQLWQDPYAWSTPELAAAIDDYAQLLEFADPSKGGQDWRRVAESVVQGETGYAVLVDRAAQEFQAASLVYGTDYTASAAPGTDGVFDLVADVFTIPVGAAHHRPAEEWLRAIASVEGQVALNALTGSTPTRADVPAAEFSDYQRSAIVSLQLDVIVPSFARGVACSSDWSRSVTDALEQFRQDGHSSALRNRLIEAARGALGLGSS